MKDINDAKEQPLEVLQVYWDELYLIYIAK